MGQTTMCAPHYPAQEALGEPDDVGEGGRAGGHTVVGEAVGQAIERYVVQELVARVVVDGALPVMERRSAKVEGSGAVSTLLHLPTGSARVADLKLNDVTPTPLYAHRSGRAELTQRAAAAGAARGLQGRVYLVGLAFGATMTVRGGPAWRRQGGRGRRRVNGNEGIPEGLPTWRRG